MEKALIGIVPLWDSEKDSLWMIPGYTKLIETCGGIPVILPLCTDKNEIDDIMELLEGILLTGGQDVNPNVYHEKKSAVCGECCDERDKMESLILEEAIALDMPVFGICRGIQFLNAYLGGSLYQDLKNPIHHMNPPYDRIVHKVKIEPNTKHSEILDGQSELGVNSYHHQAVKDVAPGLEVMAKSTDGIVEALSVKDKSFVMAVQWHPELNYEDSIESIKIVQAFVNACEVYKLNKPS